MNNPAHPYAQPWDTVIFSGLAVAIVLLTWRAMLTRVAAVTSVLFPGEKYATAR